VTGTQDHALERTGPVRSLNQVVLLLAVACGLSVANLYYAQPLLGPISRSFGVGTGSASVVLVVTQLGYAAGMVLLAPLGDLLENRRLAARVLLASAAALALAAAAPTLPVFVLAALAVGVTSVVAQILVPVAARLAPEESRGAVVGRVMTGLLLGILLARTVSSLITAALGWRAVYALSAVLVLTMSAVLTKLLPRHQPEAGPRYPALLHSMLALVREEPVLRRRALYQALMFAAFSVFWTTIADELVAGHGLSQTGVGLFALVGAAGAAAAPLAGRLGDRGHSRVGTGVAFAVAAGSLLLAALAPGSLALLAVAAVGLDCAVQTSLVLGQRAVYGLRPEARSRLNTVFITTFFLGGALGSAVGGLLYDADGWRTSALVGAALPVVGLLVWLGERARTA
jgi:predicted MFS family arabinose efflux permease